MIASVVGFLFWRRRKLQIEPKTKLESKAAIPEAKANLLTVPATTTTTNNNNITTTKVKETTAPSPLIEHSSIVEKESDLYSDVKEWRISNSFRSRRLSSSTDGVDEIHTWEGKAVRTIIEPQCQIATIVDAQSLVYVAVDAPEPPPDSTPPTPISPLTREDSMATEIVGVEQVMIGKAIVHQIIQERKEEAELEDVGFRIRQAEEC